VDVSIDIVKQEGIGEEDTVEELFFTVANPKSASLQWYCPSSKILPDFKSQCKI
jgi:hypothetical protein